MRGAARPDFGVDEAVGLPHVREPQVRQVRGQLWEILGEEFDLARALIEARTAAG
jgi:hypothetical protein